MGLARALESYTHYAFYCAAAGNRHRPLAGTREPRYSATFEPFSGRLYSFLFVRGPVDARRAP